MAYELAIIPKTITEVEAISNNFSFVEHLKGKETKADIFYKITYGLELGMTPAQSLQCIYIINGKPSLGAEAMLALVFSSGKLKYHKETIEGSIKDGKAEAVSIVQREGFDKVTTTFSIEDAKKAGLWERPMWKKYPQRMLKMRARSFSLRDNFPDVVKGMITSEEARDIIDVDCTVVEPKKEIIKEVKANNAEKTMREQPQSEAKSSDTDYQEDTNTNTNKKEVLTSSLFGEKFIILSDGSVHLDSGVVYTKEEVDAAKDMNDTDKKKLHFDKIEKEGSNINEYITLKDLGQLA